MRTAGYCTVGGVGLAAPAKTFEFGISATSVLVVVVILSTAERRATQDREEFYEKEAQGW
jgi:hypothetical protein